MKLRILNEKVFSKDLDGDGQAEVPDERQGETGKPEVNKDAGLSDTNNDGQTDPASNNEPAEPETSDEPEVEEQPGDDELAAELAALEEDVGQTIKLRLAEEEILDEGSIPRERWSKIKPFREEAQYLVYYNPQGQSPPLEGGMVRLAATVSGEGIGQRGKIRSWERNMVTLHVRQPGFKVYGPNDDPRDSSSQVLPYGEGELDYISHSIKLDGKYIAPAGDGRFIDVANWILKKKKITDQYANILDFNGKIIATKGMQKKFSNAGSSDWDSE
jgi:hypothetical protein